MKRTNDRNCRICPLTFDKRKTHRSLQSLFVAVCLLLFPALDVFGQEVPAYDEIPVFLEVPHVGGGEIDAVIKGDEVFLPVTDLFDFLKIRNIPSPDLELITGFFLNQDATYRIERAGNEIQYNGKKYQLDPGDLIRTGTNLYLRSPYFGKIFGLDCIFSFRNLSVKVETQLELPVIREMRQEELRNNLSRLKGEEKADTIIDRTYQMFQFGMADWSVISTQQVKGPAETRLNLSLGSIIAGGEATASLNYNSSEPFTEKQQQYLWRYVNNQNPFLSQIMAGKINTQATSSIYNPVVGVKLSNTPITFRRSFGSYTLSDNTEPNWIVELYVNNVLVDYTKADASGFFTFEVPLVYGSSLVKLKFYGPWGEEKTSERNISIPFSFIPKNTVEYNISAGMVEDSLFSRFSRTQVNYGLSRGVTIGGGYEYLSSVTSGPWMPFITGSFRLAPNLILYGDFTYSVRAKGSLTYRLPSNIQFDLNYTKYDREQTAINFNYFEERRASVSVPIRFKQFSAYNRMSVNQLVLPSSKYTTAEWLLSGSLFGVNTNITTYGLFIGNSTPYIYSNLALSYRFASGFRIIPQAQYGFSDMDLLSFKVGLEKKLLKHAFLNLSYEQNFKSNLRLAELAFRYDFSFAQAGISARRSDRNTTLVQYARGSIIRDRRTKYLGTDKRTNVGRGGITILAYLDQNANGTREAGEPKAYGLNLRSSSGRIERIESDTTIRIFGLEPYTNCFIEFDISNFDNIAWRLKKRTMSVVVDPNILKLIEVPISVVGEASGTVMINRDGEIEELSRMIVNFYTSDKKRIGSTLTEFDGYFSFFGLSPGSYYVQIDSSQLRKLKMNASPDSIPFMVTANLEGDYIDGLDFVVGMIPDDQDAAQTALPESVVEITTKDTTYIEIHEVVQEVLTDTVDSYAIQLGAFTRKSYARAFKNKLAALIDRDIEIIVEDGFYKVRILGFETREEVDEYLPLLSDNGVKKMWVINLKGMRKQMMLMTVTDSITAVVEIRTDMQNPEDRSDLHIQLGAFRDSARAEAFKSQLSGSISQPVIIVKEYGFYKVRIAGFTMPEERNAMIPRLNELGYDKIWVLPYDTALYETKTEVPVENVIETETDSSSVVPDKVDTEEMISAPVVEEPRFSIQAGVFRNLTEAKRAQRRIENKLGMEVIIIEEFDYARVIIPGFYKREDTYKYYPELVGLGYDNIRVIEKVK